jgi:hypothetical protein
MGLLDIFKRSKKTAEQHGDKIADGVDKATDVADDKSGGKYTEHLDKVDEMADKLRDQDTP